MGPMLHRAIKPKLSLAPSLSLRAADKPTPERHDEGDGHRPGRDAPGVECHRDKFRGGEEGQ